MQGKKINLTSDPQGQRDSGTSRDTGQGRSGRRFVGVKFVCCSTYARIYINRKETAYEGCCPKCSRPVHLKIGPGGTDQRFFSAY